jgi:hypothetical protein
MRFVLAWSRSAEISRSRCTIATLSPFLPPEGGRQGHLLSRLNYTQDLYAKNTQQTGTFFFRFAVPL